MQVDIPKGYSSERFFIPKGHYSKDFYLERVIILKILSQRVIIQKILILKGRYPKFGIMTGKKEWNKRNLGRKT